MDVSRTDRDAIRDLAKRVAEIAALPVMAERRRLWVAHNSLRPARPMVLVFPEGAWCELIDESDLVCEGEEARSIELALRRRVYQYEHFDDDMVVEADWDVHPCLSHTGWGLAGRQIASSESRGAKGFEVVLTGPEDLRKLRHPEIIHDADATAAEVGRLEELFGGILNVRRRGVTRISYHLWSQYLQLRSPSEALMDLVDQPELVHEAIAFFAEGHREILRQYVEQNLLDLNSDGTYQSSGGNGYTDELPAEGFDPTRVRPCDMWASAESQELAAVSPAMHAEFALAYERPLLDPFGLTGYGCCEDLTRKLDLVCEVPNMRRISISPWADVDVCAERLGGEYIFSWKPNPAMLVGRFDAEAVRATLRHALAAAQTHGCVLEMVLKDTHTCQQQRERFDEWTRIAREEVVAVA